MFAFPIVGAAITDSTAFTILAPLIIIAAAGFFTLRSNIAKIWRENYEAEVVKNRLLTQEIEEQRELKHQALNELAACKLELSAEKSKPDYAEIVKKLNTIVKRLDSLEHPIE